jgi:hypothetical protein
MMVEQHEYFSRVINVACRLQAAIKVEDRAPAYKALVSNTAYHKYLSCAQNHVLVFTVTRNLRNINEGEDFHCHKVEFLNPSTPREPQPSLGAPEEGQGQVTIEKTGEVLGTFAYTLEDEESGLRDTTLSVELSTDVVQRLWHSRETAKLQLEEGRSVSFYVNPLAVTVTSGPR